MADSVQLTDLDVIVRYSIAVRTASADREELIETLRADLEWLERANRRPRGAPVADAGVDEEFEPDPAEPESLPTRAANPGPPETPIRRMPATVRAGATAKKAAPKKAATKKAAANKRTSRASR